MFRMAQMVGAGVLAALVAGRAMAADPAVADRPPEPGFYALWAWSGDYLQYADDYRRTGFRWILTFGRPGEEKHEAGLLRAAQDRIGLVLALGNGGNHWRELPMDQALAKWREEVRGQVRRYGPAGTLWKEHPEVSASPCRHWLVGGEPNIEMLKVPEGVSRVDLYAQLLQAAAAEIRALDPGAVIAAFNTSDGAPHHGRGLRPDSLYQGYVGWRRFIDEVCRQVGPDVFDVVATHPYHQPLSPEEGGVITGVKMVAELAQKHGFTGKPLWFTEIGYPLEYPGNKQVRDERQQACFQIRCFAIAAAHGVRHVDVMYIKDIVHAVTLPGQGETVRKFGYYLAPGKWREVATATKVMIDLLPDPRLEVETVQQQPNGVYAYWFRGVNGWPVLVAWNSGEKELKHTFNGRGQEATLVDMLGQKVEALAVAEDGKFTVTLSEAPVYVVAAPREAVEKAAKDDGAK